MTYDRDFDINIESRWWNLMSFALKEKMLCLSIEKHITHNNTIVLQVKIYPVCTKPEIIYSKFDSDYSTQLFYDTERFVDEYKLIDMK